MDISIGKVQFYCDKEFKVYVLYTSPTSWDKTYLAIINPSTESIESFLCGKMATDRGEIAKFTNNLIDPPRLLNYHGCDRTIINDCIEIIRKAQETDVENFDLYNLLTHIHYTLENRCSITNGTAFTIDGIVSLFEQYRKLYFPSTPKENIYCGITNDLDIRTREHISKCEISPDSHVYAINCATNRVASIVELEMGKIDYYIGETHTEGNGSKNNSTIVYIAKK